MCGIWFCLGNHDDCNKHLHHIEKSVKYLLPRGPESMKIKNFMNICSFHYPKYKNVH